MCGEFRATDVIKHKGHKKLRVSLNFLPVFFEDS